MPERLNLHLLADFNSEDELEKIGQHIDDLFQRNDYILSYNAFIKQEEFLVNLGHKGKYALFCHGELFDLDNERDRLVGRFSQNNGHCHFYLDLVGGNIYP